MRSLRTTAALLAIVGSAAAADAQPFTALESALACATPPVAEAAGKDALRILGAQSTDARVAFSASDVLVVGGGTKAGVQIGQQYFIRRPLRFAGLYNRRPGVTASVGVLRIVAANETTALAIVDHTCDAIAQGDYLVPFVRPEVPAGADGAAAPSGELDFSSPAHIVAGSENHRIAAAGDFVVIDRGADQGVAPGARFAVYRDLRVPAMPLSAIGEAMVMTTGPASSVVRITRTRDAVQPGDYLVPRK